MPEHRWREQFHQRGHHVQSAHGRRTTFAADADPDDDDHTLGCMVALMPTSADAKRLAIPGGEAADELHCTLYYLGGDASAWSPDQRSALVEALTDACALLTPIPAGLFGANHWNGNGDTPSWVWATGDDPQADGSCDGLMQAKMAATYALEDSGTASLVPPQHSPWVAHVCAAYSADPSLLGALEKKLGPVTFDRVRVSFGTEDTDIPLTDDRGMTAAADPVRGQFRRRLTPLEVASRVDFAGHQRDWQQAVDAALHDWSAVTADWRNQLYAQIARGSSAADLENLHVDTSAASAELYKRMVDAANAAGRAQQLAAQQQGVTVPEWHLGDGASDDGLTAAGISGLAFLRRVAQLTASILGTALANSARKQALRLLQLYSGIRLASEVDQFLAALKDAVAKDQIGSAMSAAQQAGRYAVLSVAPRATYVASEVLDNNTCSPCSQIDGKTFSSLEDAEAAYPGGAYEDCQGGGRCRGTYYAVWDDGGLTSAAGALPAQRTPEEGTMADHVHAPCADCPGDADHFDAQAPVTEFTEHFAWDGSASRFTDAQYQRAAAACDSGDGTVKERCFLPHHDPDGALNRDGLAAAAGRFSGLKGHSADAVAAAKSHLRAHYNQLGEDIPENLAAASRTHTAAIDCPPGWKPDPDGDGCVPNIWKPGMDAPKCPPGWTRDPDHDGCVPPGEGDGDDKAKAAASTEQLAAQPLPGATPVAAPGNPAASGDDTSGNVAPWNGVLAVEGVTTGDGREFAPDSLTWRDLPIPLRWNRVDSHGGEPRTEAVNVGRIDSITRDGNQLKATGQFDLSTPDGQTAYDKVKGGFLRGVSIDADSITDADVELVWPEQQSEGESDEPDLFELLFAQPEKVVYHAGRISAATLCDIPAFAEAYVALTDDTGAVVAGGQMATEEWQAAVAAVAPEPEAVTASLAGFEPPRSWFADPKLSLPTPVTVDESGRVYGHAAMWGTCHIGNTEQCVQPPRESEHPYFMTGEVICDGGVSVSVGQITVGTGHAPLSAGAQAAAEHYDHTGAAVADVCVGNDAHGIWVAGAIRADADPSRVAALRAAGQVSGDWRRIGGKLRLVGLLAVNVPGFPVPRMRARVASGAQQALVAAGQPTVSPGYSEHDLDQLAMRRVMDLLAARRSEKE